ncbi:MAG: PH domain-containing protein [Propionibacteriaceae bacterium]|jgi:membrane protein YdbS with pleckstrin-like domain|nr:PH domain-containing protein [Propionibacteriaceae bacterium]
MSDSPPATAGLFEPPGVVWQPAQPALLTVRLIGAGITAGIVLLVGVAAWLFWTEIWVAIIAFAAFAIAASQLVLIPRRVRALGWAIRDRDLFVKHGVLNRTLSVVPYTRVQYVDITVGPIERAFGLTTLQVNTAAVGTATAVPGLSPEQAAGLREILTDKSRLDPQP